jgi:hypothetical protein
MTFWNKIVGTKLWDILPRAVRLHAVQRIDNCKQLMDLYSYGDDDRTIKEIALVRCIEDEDKLTEISNTAEDSIVRAAVITRLKQVTAHRAQSLNKSQNRPRRLKDAADFEEFTRDLNAPKQALITVSQIDKLYAAIASALSEKGNGTSGVLILIEQHLSAVCPRCGSRVRGEQIVHLAVAKEIGSDNIRFREKGVVSQLMNGSCPNASCASPDIIMRWKI